MVSCVSRFGVIFTAFFLLGSVLAVPLADKLTSLSPTARGLLKRSAPAAPRFLAYNDAYLDPLPSASQLSGFNVFALAFLLSSGAADQADTWASFSSSQRHSYLQEYNAAGISLIVSAFGSTDTPTSDGYDPVTLANTVATWVKKYDLQGVDVDYEDFGAFEGHTVKSEPWLISFTKQLRVGLPQGEYILTHAPVAPWFSPGLWIGGGYLTIHESVGHLIDWYNIQFYNQGSTEYTTCNNLLDESSGTFPQSALFQIIANGVPGEQLLIGKPGTRSDASNGYMSASKLASCVGQASARGWNGGVMVWEYPHVGSSWVEQVKASI